MKLGSQLGSADLTEHTEGKAYKIIVGVGEVDTNFVGSQHQQLRILMEELSEAQIANPFLDQRVAGNKLQALHLAEVGFLTGHVDEEKLCHIAGAHRLLVFLGKGTSTEKD